MSPWKDIGTLRPDDGSLVNVRRIPANTPIFSALWAPDLAGGGFLCGPEQWFLPWWRVWAWRYTTKSLAWPRRRSSDHPDPDPFSKSPNESTPVPFPYERFYRDTFVDPPSDSQHVWLRRDWPSLGRLHAV
ncbi:MAG: hypothetical protein ABSD29_24470 [Verrucomicrobiota bacterium]|jgi:hypothetical protein